MSATRSTTNRLVAILVSIGVVVFLFTVSGPFYVLNEGEQAVITQFGKIVRTDLDAGLQFKVPFVETVLVFPKKVLSWDGQAQRIPTLENQFIWVDTTARWKISNLAKFYESVNTLERAFARLDEIIDPATRTVISNNPLHEAVRDTNLINELSTQTLLLETTPLSDQERGAEGFNAMRDLIGTTRTFPPVRSGRAVISQQILNRVKDRTLNEFGIEILDVVIRQIRYSDDLTESVYNRMIAERKQIAEGLRSFGEGRKREILGRMEREKRSILSEAYRRAEEIKGRADAQAAEIYAAAYRQDPEFFTFWRAIDSYRQVLPRFRTTLTTDLDYFRYLYSPSGRR